MANKYWVGGNGNWSSATNWRTASGGTTVTTAPGSSDAAFLDANSGTSVVTVDSNVTIQTLTCTNFTGTLAFGTNTITLNGTGTIFNGTTGMTVTGTNPLIICTATVTTTARTIAPAAVTESNSISFRFTNSTASLSINTGSVRDLDFTDGTNATGYGGQAQNMLPTIYGNFKASTNMTKAGGTGTFTFSGAVTGTRTITTAGVVFDNPFTFNSTAATPTDVIWQLQDNLTAGIAGGTNRTTTLTAGTLDLNGKTLTASLFNSSNSNTRTLAFGTNGKIIVNGTNGTVFNINTSTGLTVTGLVTGRLVEANTGGSGTTRTFGGGISLAESSAVNILVSGGGDTVAISGTGGSFGNVSFVGFTGTLNVSNNTTVYGNWTFGSGMATAVTGTGTVNFLATSGTKTITSNGKSFNGNVTFNSSGSGATFQLQDALVTASAVTLTAGTLDLNTKTLTANSYAGTGSAARSLLSYSVPITITGNSTTVISLGTTTNLTVDTRPTFQLDSSTAATGTTRTITWGASSNFPAVPNINVINGADTVTTSGTTTLNSLTFSGTFTGILGNAQRNIYGNLTLKTGMSLDAGTLSTVFIGVGSQTITTARLTLDFPITFNGNGGTWSMQDALTMGSSRTLTLQDGTLKLKSGTTNQVGSFATSGATQKYLQSTISGTRATISQASGTVNTNYLTVQDNAATGLANWNAPPPTNANSGNNTGWNFVGSGLLLSF